MPEAVPLPLWSGSAEIAASTKLYERQLAEAGSDLAHAEATTRIAHRGGAGIPHDQVRRTLDSGEIKLPGPTKTNSSHLHADPLGKKGAGRSRWIAPVPTASTLYLAPKFLVRYCFFTRASF